ncbi:MAG: beta-ketoacyl synthase chain length factor [Arachidicoccus sp.]|nr:beta-ketoacyl synthase chain length factor [Arachidicoccus sp.]
MLYIHQSYCISPQQTFMNVDWNVLHEAMDNKLKVVEPAYENIPRNVLRRMGKSVRIGVGAAFPIINEIKNIAGIIIGTATAGKEDSFTFLKQVMDYDEGLLTPTNFVQSTSNAIAAQIGMLSANKFYNITHVHKGLAFENAMFDAAMQLKENPQHDYLLGGVDEISDDDFNLNNLAGWYKKEIVSNKDLYESNSSGSLAGEGSAMFLINDKKENAAAKVVAIKTLFTKDEEEIKQQTKELISENKIDVFISGENGDNRLQRFYNACESLLEEDIAIVHFKHLCGEYPTTTAFATFLACDILQKQSIPNIVIKKSTDKTSFGNILIYNNYQGEQHSFILISKA